MCLSRKRPGPHFTPDDTRSHSTVWAVTRLLTSSTLLLDVQYLGRRNDEPMQTKTLCSTRPHMPQHATCIQHETTRAPAHDEAHVKGSSTPSRVSSSLIA